MSRQNQPSTVEPQQERAQQKRQALLRSGLELFVARGYDRVTAKEIAAHAGVAVGTFYRYFADKKQLLLTLLEDRVEDLLSPEPPVSHGPPELMVEEMLRGFFRESPQLGIRRACEEMIRAEPDVAARVAEARERSQAKIRARLRKMQEAGLTWPDIDTATAAWAIFSLVTAAMQQERFADDDLHHLARVIARMVFPPAAR